MCECECCAKIIKMIKEAGSKNHVIISDVVGMFTRSTITAVHDLGYEQGKQIQSLLRTVKELTDGTKKK